MKTAREQFDDIAEALSEARCYANSLSSLELIDELDRRFILNGDTMTLSDHEAELLREIGNRE
jgi:methyl coenzyme M reductase alpha subunit